MFLVSPGVDFGRKGKLRDLIVTFIWLIREIDTNTWSKLANLFPSQMKKTKDRPIL